MNCFIETITLGQISDTKVKSRERFLSNLHKRSERPSIYRKYKYNRFFKNGSMIDKVDIPILEDRNLIGAMVLKNSTQKSKWRCQCKESLWRRTSCQLL